MTIYQQYILLKDICLLALAPGASLSWLLPYGARVLKVSPCHSCTSKLYMGRSAAGEHEVSKNLSQESQIESTVGYFL